jgi:benzylsuccinate CoA-transferase BbsF subunit
MDAAPLKGIKVIDFSWSVVGPNITAYLGYFGAEVVKVESIHTPEVTRRSAPFKDNIVGIDRSLVFPTHNTNKYSICLNLKNPNSHAVVLKLVKWADIVVQSTTGITLQKLGLSYSALKAANERIIVLNTTNQGQTGINANHPGYGDSAVALAGFPEVTGWPDSDPSLPPGAYTDSVTPWYGALAVLAALRYRDRTGLGQHIDLSQLEAGLHMLAPAFIRYSANNVLPGRTGNRSFSEAPHGVYRCLGNDRWCAITVTSEDSWQAFCRAIGTPGWVKGPQFATMSDRKKNEDELDRLVESWTATLSPEEVMKRLQAAGVASGVVKTIEDLHNDIQLAHRGHFKRVSHPEVGEYSIELPPARFSISAAEVRRPSPRLGEHTEYVCCRLLGMSEDEFVRLYSENVFE